MKTIVRRTAVRARQGPIGVATEVVQIAGGARARRRYDRGDWPGGEPFVRVLSQHISLGVWRWHLAQLIAYRAHQQKVDAA